jgi:hypothetical protein
MEPISAIVEDLKCKCGGKLWRRDYDHETGYEAYICDNCDLEWISCDLCGGDLHSYGEKGQLIHTSLY